MSQMSSSEKDASTMAGWVCREAFEEISVLASGDVVCGCMDADGWYALGNIRKRSVYEIFRGRRYAELRRALRESDQSTFCPSLNCACPSKSLPWPSDLQAEKPVIRKIRLETISFCNLRCPECKVTEWYEERKKRGVRARLGALRRFLRGERVSVRAAGKRLAKLPPDCVRRLICDVRETLKDLWIYNYGEPFLDTNLLDYLRFIRKTAPRVWVYTHTNGNVIPDGWIERIVEEDLLDHISFSIDGATPETYARYRQGGSFETAFRAMVEFTRLKRALGKEKPKLTWQYILFNWNDSPEELRAAQDLAERHGIEIQWILTHTEGKSQRFREDSPEYYRLQGIKHFSSDILASRRNRRTPS